MKLSRLIVFGLALSLLLFPSRPSVLVAQQPATTANDIQSKAPSVVLILRHAEKPMNDKDPNLTARGFQRAQALPALFLQAPGPTAQPRLPLPSFLFATATSKHSDRPIETITPLSQALHLKINHVFEDHETTALASEILNGKYAGKVVLICWHHGEIPNLAQAFGVTNAPKRWDDAVFDQIWRLEWKNGQVRFSTMPEHLLSGDSSNEAYLR